MDLLQAEEFRYLGVVFMRDGRMDNSNRVLHLSRWRRKKSCAERQSSKFTSPSTFQSSIMVRCVREREMIITEKTRAPKQKLKLASCLMISVIRSQLGWFNLLIMKLLRFHHLVFDPSHLGFSPGLVASYVLTQKQENE